MENLDISVFPIEGMDNAMKVILSGTLEVKTLPPLEEFLKKLEDQPEVKYLIVDCTQLVRLDSTGISYFIRWHDMMDGRQGAICFYQLHREVRRVMSILGTEEFFNIQPSWEAAWEFIKQQR